MTYLEQLAAAHKERIVRLSRRAPEAGPPRIKPRPRIIPLDRHGRRIVPEQPKPLPNYPALPPPPTMPPPSPFGQVTVAQVVFAVAKAFDLSPKSILNRNTRRAHIVWPRQVAFYLCRSLRVRSLPEIGRRMGGFDHTTVLHGCKKIKRLVADDGALKEKIEAIKKTLTATI